MYFYLGLGTGIPINSANFVRFILNMCMHYIIHACDHARAHINNVMHICILVVSFQGYSYK